MLAMEAHYINQSRDGDCFLYLFRYRIGIIVSIDLFVKKKNVAVLVKPWRPRELKRCPEREFVLSAAVLDNVATINVSRPSQPKT